MSQQPDHLAAHTALQKRRARQTQASDSEKRYLDKGRPHAADTSAELADAPLSANTREATIDPINGAGLDQVFADTDESRYEGEL